jgi:hypothetical protein
VTTDLDDAQMLLAIARLRALALLETLAAKRLEARRKAARDSYPKIPCVK